MADVCGHIRATRSTSGPGCVRSSSSFSTRSSRRAASPDFTERDRDVQRQRETERDRETERQHVSIHRVKCEAKAPAVYLT